MPPMPALVPPSAPRLAAAAVFAALTMLAGCETPGQGPPAAPPSSPEVVQTEHPKFRPPVPRPPSPELAKPQLPHPVEADRIFATRPRPSEHVVRQGEDLYVIATGYGIDAYALASANGLSPPFAVTPGQRLVLPPEPAVAAAPAPERTVAADSGKAAENAPTLAAAPVPRAPGITDERGFIWPVNGDVISEFGAKGDGLYNDGINIAASRGAPVRAAETGVVAYAGNELRGFGNMLLIKHPDGWVTAYAHTEEMLVGKGERVSKGQVIARVGTSGSVTRPQLHFEMRQGKKAVDPLQYLRRSNA